MSGIGQALGQALGGFGSTISGQKQASSSQQPQQKSGQSSISKIGQLFSPSGGSGSPDASGFGGSTGGEALGDAQMGAAAFGDADFKEPGGQSHVTLREEPFGLLLKNQLTGQLGKVATQPLSPEEQQQAKAPHGAGPLDTNDPSKRQFTQVSDGDLVPAPGLQAQQMPPAVGQDVRGMPIQQAPVALPNQTAPEMKNPYTDAFAKIDEAQARHANIKNAELIAYQQAMQDAKQSLLKTTGTSHAANEGKWQEHLGNAGTFVTTPEGNTSYVGDQDKRALDVLTPESGVPSGKMMGADGATPPMQNFESGGGVQNYDIGKKHTYKDMDFGAASGPMGAFSGGGMDVMGTLKQFSDDATDSGPSSGASSGYADMDLGPSSPHDIAKRMMNSKMEEMGMKMMSALDKKFKKGKR